MNRLTLFARTLSLGLATVALPAFAAPAKLIPLHPGASVEVPAFTLEMEPTVPGGLVALDIRWTTTTATHNRTLDEKRSGDPSVVNEPWYKLEPWLDLSHNCAGKALDENGDTNYSFCYDASASTHGTMACTGKGCNFHFLIGLGSEGRNSDY